MTAPDVDPPEATAPPRAPLTRPAPGRSLAPLSLLMRDVAIARALLAQQRQTGASRASVDEARAQVVAALTSYTAALAARQLPVPYALRDELRLQLRIPKNR